MILRKALLTSVAVLVWPFTLAHTHAFFVLETEALHAFDEFWHSYHREGTQYIVADAADLPRSH